MPTIKDLLFGRFDVMKDYVKSNGDVNRCIFDVKKSLKNFKYKFDFSNFHQFMKFIFLILSYVACISFTH